MLMGTYFLPKLLAILPEWVMEEFSYASMFIFTLGIAVVANTFRVRLWKKN
jgi:mannose/fructose/N-acetylgalactosamine-specific phosphotransferase system component IIC